MWLHSLKVLGIVINLTDLKCTGYFISRLIPLSYPFLFFDILHDDIWMTLKFDFLGSQNDLANDFPILQFCPTFSMLSTRPNPT